MSEVVQKVAEKLASFTGYRGNSDLNYAKLDGLSIRKDSNDWASSDDGFAGFIMWEEGPEDWPFLFWEFFNQDEECLDIAAEIEIICSWGLIGIIEV